jgi:hypothetical protein
MDQKKFLFYFFDILNSEWIGLNVKRKKFIVSFGCERSLMTYVEMDVYMYVPPVCSHSLQGYVSIRKSFLV